MTLLMNHLGWSVPAMRKLLLWGLTQQDRFKVEAEHFERLLSAHEAAGDERALNLAAAVPAAPAFGAPLSVDIGAAMAAKEAAEGASSGLTPALHGLMRMSPRVSNNQFSSVALLKGAGM